MRLEKVIACFVTFSLCAGLTACHKNPLMSEKNISSIKSAMGDSFFFSMNGRTLRQCPAWFANHEGDPAISETCDKWVKRLYSNLESGGDISSSATMENFLDPKLWEVLRKKKV